MPECFYCQYSAFDITDGPYCVAPKVLEVAPYGLNLSSLGLAKICPAPEHPHWTLKPPPSAAPGDVEAAGGGEP